MVDVRIEGGCYCGQVRYALSSEPIYQTICHCAHCRGTCGAPAVSFVTVADAHFAWTSRPVEYRSSEHVVRTFCGVCGTSLTYRHDQRGEVDIHSATLDDPEAWPPDRDFYVDDKLSWMPTCTNNHRDAP